MPADARELARVRNPVLILSAITWVLLVTAPGGIAVHPHLHAAASSPMPLGASLEMLLAMNPPATLAMGWVLMLIAMMAPVLIMPIRHIRQRSFARRRTRFTALFVAGYGVIWLAAGVVVLAIELAIKILAPQSYLPAIALFVVALVWQFSPIKQRCLNGCHASSELSAFGAAADRDALAFGVAHGISCAGSCWSLMLFPMLLPEGHTVAMGAVSFLIFSERLEHPMPPSWRWRGFTAIKRIVIAHAGMQFRQRRSVFISGGSHPN